MMWHFLQVIGVLSVFGVVGVSSQDAPATCVAECANESKGQFANYGCTSAAENACLCVSGDFQNSVRDCSVARCAATAENIDNYLVNDLCVGVPLPEPSEAALTTAGISSSVEVPSSSEVPATTEIPVTSEAAAVSTTVPVETSVAEPTNPPVETPVPAESTAVVLTTESIESPAPTSVVVAETTGVTTSGEPESTSEAAATSSANAGNDETQDEDDDELPEAVGGGGLSSGAAAGIGVGVAVVIIAIGIVAVVLWLRSRKRNQKAQPVGIFNPMPHTGPGRYGSADHGYMEKRGGESIELTSNRYEDMVPRTVPRTMV